MTTEYTLKRLDRKLDALDEKISGIILDINDIKHDVSVNTDDLTEHKEGVIQNRERIVALERIMQPITVRELSAIVVKYLTVASIVLGSAYTLMKIMAI